MRRRNKSVITKFFAQVIIMTAIGVLILWSNVRAENVTQKNGRIVFVSWDFQVMSLDMKSSRVTQLTKSGTNLWPRWSFDGKKIAFASIRGEHKNREIYVMDADGKNRRRVTFTNNGNTSYPRWGVNESLYFRSAVRGVIQENSIDLVSGEIKVISTTRDVSGRTLKERIEQRKRIYQIFPSYDGKYQALYFEYEGVELLEMTTGTRRELKAINPGQPSWSKDSKRVAYVSGSIPELVLKIFDVKENKYEEIKLPSGPDTGCGGELSWNASSTQIVFSCSTPYGEKPDSWLYVLDIKSQESSKLIKGSSPDWR